MAQVYCPACFRLVEDTAPACPGCGAADPGRFRVAVAGVFLFATLVAGLAAEAYSYGLSLVWPRWLAWFEDLPFDHAFRGQGSDAAFGLGLGLFVVTWLALAGWCWRCVRSGRR